MTDDSQENVTHHPRHERHEEISKDAIALALHIRTLMDKYDVKVAQQILAECMVGVAHNRRAKTLKTTLPNGDTVTVELVLPEGAEVEGEESTTH